ncbi:hypothetical protein EBR96_08100, partial [bacterium]|nr:hypothetical protein [bacterium]
MTEAQLNALSEKIAVLFQKRDFENALVTIDEALTISPTADISHLKALCYLELNQYDSAEQLFKRLLDSGYGDSLFKTDYADLLTRMGRETDAETLLNTIIKDDPTCGPALFALGLSRFTKESYEEALAYFERATNAPNPISSFFTLRARTLAALNQLPAASEFYQTALSMNPDDIEALFFGSETESVLHNMERAVDYLSRASLITPENPEIFYRLGLVQFGGGNLTEAIRALKNAAKLEPENPLFRYYLALFLIQANKADDSLKVLKPYSAETPENAGFLCLIGLAFQQKKQLKEAKRLYDVAEKLDPKSPIPLIYRSGLYFDVKKYELALADAEKALQNEPD